MTPATSFEKYFSRWLVFTVVFLIVFLITYKLADYTKVLVYSLVYPEITQLRLLRYLICLVKIRIIIQYSSIPIHLY